MQVILRDKKDVQEAQIRRSSRMLPLIDISALQVESIPRRGDDFFMFEHERNVLVALVRSVHARSVLEIGVQDGHAARTLLEKVSSIEQYVGVDVEPSYVTSLVAQRRERPQQPGCLVRADLRFRLILKPRGSLDLTADDLPKFDVVLIDGDHGREAVIHDSALARSVVRPGGIVIWHDYYQGPEPCEVRDVLDEMWENGAPISRIADTWFAIEMEEWRIALEKERR